MNRSIVYIFYCVLIFFSSCASNSNETQISKVDTIGEFRINKDSNADLTDDPAPDLQQLVDQYKSYAKSGERIDTSLMLGTDSFHIVLNHRSKNGSGIVVPGKYVSFYGLNQFETSAFQSQLVIHKNGSVFSDKIIEKEDFDFVADESLSNYGVLLYPNLDICRGYIEIQYSLSVPLSDIGSRVYVQIQNDGSLKFMDGYDCD